MKRRLTTALACLLLIAAAAGCQHLDPNAPKLTPLGQVDEARQLWTEAHEVIAPLIEAGLIRDRDTLLAIKAITEQVPKDLDAAEAHARAGNGFTVDFLLKRVHAAIAALKNAKGATHG